MEIPGGSNCLQLSLRVLYGFSHYSTGLGLFIHSFYFFKTSTTQKRSRHSTDTVPEFHAKRQRQLWVKDLSKVPTWRLERESNPWLFGRKASTLPKRHQVPQRYNVIIALSIWTSCELTDKVGWCPVWILYEHVTGWFLEFSTETQ